MRHDTNSEAKESKEKEVTIALETEMEMQQAPVAIVRARRILQFVRFCACGVYPETPYFESNFLRLGSTSNLSTFHPFNLHLLKKVNNVPVSYHSIFSALETNKT